MSQQLTFIELDALLGGDVSQEQWRTVVAQFLRGERPGAPSPEPPADLDATVGDAYDAAIDRAFLAVFGLVGNEHAGAGRGLPLRSRPSRPPELRIAIEILAHRAVAGRAAKALHPGG